MKVRTVDRHTARLLSFVATFIVATITLFFAHKVLAEQFGGSNESGVTSRIVSLYNELVALSYGSDTDTEDWGAMWNRIKTAAKWQPDGDANASDVSPGKTFNSGNSRDLKTGAMAVGSLSDSSESMAAGYYTSTDLSVVDTDLIDDNIKKDSVIFGITGLYEGVCSSGLPLTGQTTVYETGDDGTYQKGVSNAFTDNGDGTVTHSATALTWPKAWNGEAANNGATVASWTEAVQYCYNGTFFGSSEWRLPNINELISILDSTRSSPPTFSVFTDVATEMYWSSTTPTWGTTYAWYVVMVNGGADTALKTGVNRVVCVKD